MSTYGRKATTSPASGTISNAARAYVPQAMPENGWGYAWGMHAGRSTATIANVRGQVWRAAGGVPGALIASTNPIAADNPLGSGTGTGEVSGPTTAIFAMDAGSQYPIGALVRDGTLLHGMQATGLPTGADNQFYTRAIANLNPLDPMAHTGTLVAGWMTAWVEYAANVAPDVPINRAPLSTVQGLPAVFTGAFRDTNESVNGQANAGEKLSKYRIQLRAVGSGTLVWDGTYTADSIEQANRAFAIGYMGTGTLDAGIDYEWRCQVADHFETWSAWSGWLTFTILAAGAVTPNDPPGVVGKQDTQQPQPYRVVYTHNDSLSADRVQIQILSPAGAILRDETIPGTYAPGAHEINLWPSSVVALPWSASYRWRMRMRDSAGEWSSWSPQITFNTDYSPTVPGSLLPAGGVVISGYPDLSFAMTDADDDPGTGLVATVRIKDGTGVLLQTRAAALGVDDRWHYQTTATDLPATDTYRWDAMGDDGILTTAWSSEADFFYAQSPTVVSPAVDAVVTSTTLEVSYTITGQVRRHVLIYPRAGSSAILNTAWYAGSAMTASIDMAAFAVNGSLYDLVVEVELPGSVVSRSPRIPFELLLNAGHSVAVDPVQSGPIRIASEPEDTAIRMTRTATTGVTSGNFVAWRVKEGPADWLDRWQSLIANPPANPNDALRAKARLAADLSTVAESSSFPDLSLTYFEPRLGVPMSYTLTAVIKTGLNTVESLPVDGILAVCDATNIVLHDVRDPTGLRVWLESMEDGDEEDNRNQALYETWSDGPPAIAESGLEYLTFSDTYRLRPDGGEDVRITFDRLRALRRFRPDDSPIICCRRDDLGQRHDIRITGLKANRRRLQRMDAHVEMTEVLR